MATLHLICGLPGSGKSTLAKKLEASGSGFRFTPDEWLLDLGHDLYDAIARDRVERLQWRLAQRLLASGVDAILENGFWSRAERDHYRSTGEALGAEVRLYFTDTPLCILKDRIVERNRVAPAEAKIEPGDLERWAETFERPTEDELAVFSNGAWF